VFGPTVILEVTTDRVEQVAELDQEVTEHGHDFVGRDDSSSARGAQHAGELLLCHRHPIDHRRERLRDPVDTGNLPTMAYCNCGYTPPEALPCLHCRRRTEERDSSRGNITVRVRADSNLVIFSRDEFEDDRMVIDRRDVDDLFELLKALPS